VDEICDISRLDDEGSAEELSFAGDVLFDLLRCFGRVQVEENYRVMVDDVDVWGGGCRLDGTLRSIRHCDAFSFPLMERTRGNKKGQAISLTV
jgi:hypothetical protein